MARTRLSIMNKTALRTFRSALCSAALLGLIACADPGSVSLTNAPTALASGGAAMAYTLQIDAICSVVAYSLSSSGNQTPVSTLLLPAAFGPTALAVDPTSGAIYVGGLVYGVSTTPTVFVYAAGASGNATPQRTITGTALPGNFDEPVSMAVDKTGQLYILSTPKDTAAVAVYAAGATGAATPVRAIYGTNVGMYDPTQIAVDSSQNIYVSSSYPDTDPLAGSLVEYGPTDTGNSPPDRAITDIKHIFNGLTVDASGNLWVLALTLDSKNNYSGPILEEFGPSQSGPATPIRSVRGSETGLAIPFNIRVDSKSNVYVLQYLSATTTPTLQLLGFGPDTNGNARPPVSITANTLVASAPRMDVY